MQVLKMLYDKEIVAEEAILAWADEKESAEAHERVFLKRWACISVLVPCLRCVPALQPLA